MVTSRTTSSSRDRADCRLIAVGSVLPYGGIALVAFATSLFACSHPFLHLSFSTGFLWFLAQKSVVPAQYVPSAVPDFCLNWLFQDSQNICWLPWTSFMSPSQNTACTKYFTWCRCCYRSHHRQESDKPNLWGCKSWLTSSSVPLYCSLSEQILGGKKLKKRIPMKFRVTFLKEFMS